MGNIMHPVVIALIVVVILASIGLLTFYLIKHKKSRTKVAPVAVSAQTSLVQTSEAIPAAVQTNAASPAANQTNVASPQTNAAIPAAGQTAAVVPAQVVTATPTTTPPQVMGRFVKISNPVIGCMNLTELQVFSVPQGANLARGKKVTKSSGYPFGADTQPGDLLVDGNYSTFAHTSCTEAPWMTVDLGASIVIYSVVVYNRMDGNCGNRTTGSIVSILDSSGNAIYSSAPFPDKQGNTTMNNLCGDNTRQPFTTYSVMPPSPIVYGG